MSIKTIESVEFECDGHCSTKSVVRRPTELPPGWMITIDEGKTNHFCIECASLMKVMLYNQKRQFAFLSTMTEDELDDYDLDILFGKLKAAEAVRLRHEAHKDEK